ncbi:lipopolysaccharide biosynthesis protein [candidate division WOR-3 bacterium]|nr:lipopolysaccharide biosynthesis protein [candidate division WOR-3 bacterium]
MQTKISIISSILSGILAIYMAYTGFGVWSLVWRTIAGYFITTILLWMWSHWYPIRIFNYNALKEHFKFGYKLLFSGLINTLYINIYYLVIGKFFSAADLGYYIRAENFTKLPSANITNVVQRVSYPVLSSIQDNSQKLKEGYRKLIKSTMFISFVLMFGLSASAKPLVLTLLGEKWLPSVPYLQLFCFSSVLFPLHALNLNMLKVKGRSDLFLKLEIIKKVIAIPVIFIGIFLGIKLMLIGMIFHSIIAYLLNSFWSGKMVNYPTKEQILDILPSLFLSTFMGVVVGILGYFLNAKPLLILLVQISAGALITIGISRILRLDAFMEIKDIFMARVSKNNQI